MLRSEFVKLAGVLNTTCYAILGVLAIKERSAYELAQEMQHCFEYFWPRADARVYDDARRLAHCCRQGIFRDCGGALRKRSFPTPK